MSKSFKALEVPDFTRKFVPKQHAGKLTEPEPFNLTTDSRHARYEAQLQAKKEAEDTKNIGPTVAPGGCVPGDIVEDRKR